MDHEEGKHALTDLIRKYRWAVAVLLAGIFLMMLPEGTTPSETDPVPDAQEKQLQEQLECLLSEICGAGRVEVLLTEATGEQIWYQTDADKRAAEERLETVMITSPDRSETGLVRRIDPPAWQGAVVVCQGADSPVVKLAIVEAVSTATGLSTDRISVLKMK